MKDSNCKKKEVKTIDAMIKMQRSTKILITSFLIFLLTTKTYAQGDNKKEDYTKYPNLAKTPPMGWNSWNKFSCNVDEVLIKEIADKIVSSGMRDAGYIYINIDDCWHGLRDSLGFIHPDAKRFPSGMKSLADYIHAKGLKLGIYSDAGSHTCGGRPGSRGHEFQDALTYAKWGIDYLKYDWCNTEGLKAEGAYKTMAAALKKAGRPIVLSICEWGDNQPWEWGQPVGHLWRTTGDIHHCFDCIIDHGTWKSWGVMQILDKQVPLRKYAGPDHWNDPDMMEVGNGMTAVEDKAHFAMWCMLSAPLIAGNDVRSMSAETKATLINKELIALDQDSLGIPAWRYSAIDSLETWIKPLKNGAWAICFLNRSSRIKPLVFEWNKQQIKDQDFNMNLNFNQDHFEIKDLWKNIIIGNTKKVLKSEIGSHDVLLLKLSKM